LAERNLPTLDEPQVRLAVTHGSAGLITSAFGLEAGHPDFEPPRQALLANYRQCLTDRPRPFPGITQVLEALTQADIAWGIVTNKPFEYTSAIVAGLAWPSPPRTVVCPDHVRHTKPDPEPMLLACTHVGISPHQALVVGDHLRDIESGRRAGSATVAVSYGYLDADEDATNWGADHTIERAEQLLDILF